MRNLVTMRLLVTVALTLLTGPVYGQGVNAPPARPATPQTAAQPPAGEELDAGTDPSKSSRRVNLYHEYYKIQNGFSFNTTTAQLTFPILGNGGNVQLKLPFTYAELGQARPFGIGDMSINLILLPTKWDSLKAHWTNPRVTPFLGIETFVPSADSTLRLDPAFNRITTLSMGTGKYRVNTMGGVAWTLSREWLILPLYSQEVSFAGDPAFDDINQGKIRIFVQYQHHSGVYFKPEFQWVLDFEDDNRVDWYIAPEVGRVMKGGTVFYVKPGWGLLDDPNNRDWGFELGVRQKF